MDSTVRNSISSIGTGSSGDALLASKDIILLAEEVLPKSAYVKAETYASMLAGLPVQQEGARLALMNVLLPPPQDPIYKLAPELYLLPRRARRAIPILGKYLDMLTKAAAYEKCRDKDILTVSFSNAIDIFSRYYTDNRQLTDWLLRYNRFFYRDAKLDIMLPSGRIERKFRSREVVMCLYITRELADRIKALSATASRVSLDQPM